MSSIRALVKLHLTSPRAANANASCKSLRVRVADTGRVYAHQRVKGAANVWLCDFFDPRSLFELFDEHRFHDLNSSC